MTIELRKHDADELSQRIFAAIESGQIDLKVFLVTETIEI